MLELFQTWNLRRKILAWFLLVAMVPMIVVTAANLFFFAKNFRNGMGERLSASRKGLEIELKQKEKRLLNQAERYAGQALLVQTIASGNRETIRRLLTQLLEFSELDLLGIYDDRGNPVSILQKGQARSASIKGSVFKMEEVGFWPLPFDPPAYAEEDFSFDLPKSGKSDDPSRKGSPSSPLPAEGETKETTGDPLSAELIRRIKTDGRAVVWNVVEGGIELSIYKMLHFSGREVGFIREAEWLDQDFIDAIQQRVGLGVALVNPAGKKIISTLAGIDLIGIDQGVQSSANGKVDGENYLYMVLPLSGEQGIVQGGVVLLQSLDTLAASQRQITLFSFFLFGGVGVIVALVSLKTANSLSLPLHQIMEVLKYAEREGDLTRRIKVDSKDEIGELGRWFNSFAEKFSGIIFRVKESTQSLAVSSEELSSSSQQMGENSSETERLATTVSSASEQTNRSVQSVATSAEEMTVTLKEISRNVLAATQIISQAVDVAQGTNQTISKLGESSAEIGEVVKVITAIAQQTNLLALNAAIEAARAGEAGKGFAVVANEVKDLAKKTAKATEEIGQKIGIIQTDTREAVSAIGKVSGIILQVNEIAATIAGALEEQTATTNEIGRSVMEAARGTGEVAQSISGVVGAARSTAEGAGRVLAASKKLAVMGNELMTMVSHFRVDEESATDRFKSGDSKAERSVEPFVSRRPIAKNTELAQKGSG